MAVDLAQPGVLRIPGVVHGHRPLRDGVERVAAQVGGCVFQGRIPKGQGVEIGVNAGAQMLRRLAAFCLALRGQAEGLQGIRINRQLHRIVLLPPAFFLRKVQVFAVPVAHEVHALWHVVLEHAVVLFVGFPLLGVGFATQMLVAVFATPAHQKSNAGLGLEVDYKVRIAGEFTRAFGRGESRELQAPGQLNQHFLEGFALPQRFDHGHAH